MNVRLHTILIGTVATKYPFTEITCADLPAVDNAVISYSSTTSPRPVDTVATYECMAGYSLEGSVTRTCQENELFDGEEPRCVLIRKLTHSLY